MKNKIFALIFFVLCGIFIYGALTFDAGWKIICLALGCFVVIFWMLAIIGHDIQKIEDEEIEESAKILEIPFPLRDQVAELRNPDTNNGLWKWKN